MPVRLVAVPFAEWKSRLWRIAVDARAAARTSLTALPGDTADTRRYSALAARIEQVAAESPGLDSLAVSGELEFDEAGSADSWVTPEGPRPTGPPDAKDWVDKKLGEGFIVVQLFAFAPVSDLRRAVEGPVGFPAPSRVFQAKKDSNALIERFEDQLAAAPGLPLDPTNVPNRPLALGLRKLASGIYGCGEPKLIAYSDGSVARPFPRGTSQLATVVPEEWRVIALSMMSMRHPEMDVKVVGALLRNIDVSRPVAHAHKDETAYLKATAALCALLVRGPLHLQLYQTGLQPAVVGIYRAIGELVAGGEPIAVTPHHFRTKRGQPQGTWTASEPWIDSKWTP